MIDPMQSALDELSDLLDEDGLFQYYVRPSIVTIKVEPSSAAFLDVPAAKLDTNETVREECVPCTGRQPIDSLLDPSFSTVVQCAKSFEGKIPGSKDAVPVLTEPRPRHAPWMSAMPSRGPMPGYIATLFTSSWWLDQSPVDKLVHGDRFPFPLAKTTSSWMESLEFISN